jgi:hypothetical protein
MTWLISLALLLMAGAEAPGAESAPRPDQSFKLEPGDFRWVPFTVRQTPTSVDCSFEVVQGNATVHAELLPMSEFRLFDRGRPHETMAVSATGARGAFRRVIDAPGQYAVVVVNARNVRRVMVSLHLETELNPKGADVARTLPPGRRLAVLLISFGVFLVTAAWSSRKLIRAMRSG